MHNDLIEVTQESDMGALKSCPFCGSEVTVKDRGDGDLFVMLCPEESPCFGSGLATYGLRSKKTEAVAVWNTRARSADNG